MNNQQPENCNPRRFSRVTLYFMIFLSQQDMTEWGADSKHEAILLEPFFNTLLLNFYSS